VRVDPNQCLLQSRQLSLVSYSGCDEHGLLLHRIHACQSANPGLVQLNRLAALVIGCRTRRKLNNALLQQLA
jgi:hypothetical protein